MHLFRELFMVAILVETFGLVTYAFAEPFSELGEVRSVRDAVVPVRVHDISVSSARHRTEPVTGTRIDSDGEEVAKVISSAKLVSGDSRAWNGYVG